MNRPIDASDETFHPAGEDPHWNESAWFGVPLPDRRMNGFVYFFHDVRTGTSGGGPAFWDPSGQETYDCRYYDWRWLQPPTGPLRYADFTLPNSLRHQVLEPEQRYRLSYAGPGLELDVEWTALMAPHEIRYDGLASMTGARHFDQPGRVTGTVVLDGMRMAVDAYSLRDRTWGPHRPGASRPGDYLWAIASAADNWHAITIAPDLAGGTGEPGVDQLMNGYLVRDGELGELVRGERRVVERRRGAPHRVVLDAQDDRGRTLHAEGRVQTALRWFGWPGRLAFWTLTDWHWDDHQGWGENQEFFPRDQVRALLQERDNGDHDHVH